MTPCDDADPSVAKPECQAPKADKSAPWCGDGGGGGSGGRGRALCSIRTPFWWYGGRGGASRPGGDPNEYEPRPRRVVRVPDDIPNVLQRLEADVEGQYLPGQMVLSANSAGEGEHDPHVHDGGEDGAGWSGRSHEHCSCRRETWVRGGPLGPNRPDPSKGCGCACCRPRPAWSPQPRAVPVCPKTPEETWRPRPPFWWWCHDMRSRRPGGDPSLYAAVLPGRAPQPAPPLARTFEVDHPGFYLPGQIAFGFKPSTWRYWRPQPEDCPDEYLALSGLVKAEDEEGSGGDDTGRCGSGTTRGTRSCSEHGGRPLHSALLPSLVCTPVTGAGAAPPRRLLSNPKPPCASEVTGTGSCGVCCRQVVDDMANMLPYGWRGWPGIKKAHLFYRDLSPCQRVAHCTRCKC